MSLQKYASKIERLIAARLVRKAIAAGYQISVYDGEETTVRLSRSRIDVLNAMASTDHDVLRLYKTDEHGTERIGWIMLIWGNDEDLISDYSDNDRTRALVTDIEDWQAR